MASSSEPAIDIPSDTALSIPELFQATMQAHVERRVDQARAGYVKLRELAPLNADSWHLSAVFEAQYGSPALAKAWILQAIELDPDQGAFHNNLGNVHVRDGQIDDAERCYRRALALDPERLDAKSNLGLLLRWRGDFKTAEELYLDVLKRAPGFVDARKNLVSLYMRMGRMREAMVEAAAGLLTAPRNTMLRRLLGRAYAEYGEPGKAIELYENWQREDPDHPEPAHHLAALRGTGIPERASDAYVVEAFAGFAASFDAKLAMLEYRAPQLVGDYLAEVLGSARKSLRFIDAGCGTGLCAPQVDKFARSLVGVDLTQQMLDRAVERGGYDELVQGELVAFLHARPASCDVIISADTLCYFGRLDEFAAAARQALDASGWLVFTVEAHGDIPGRPDYRLQLHGRYSHRRGYVEAILAEAGFADIALREVVLRNEGNSPVMGWLTRARLPPAA